MKKNMYSIMLMESVVAKIDQLAYARNTNRSNLINQILAQHLSLETPETKIKAILDLVASKMNNHQEFKILAMPSEFMVSIKSPLAYKYRPTIKYSVELYRTNAVCMGELRVVFRTQHIELLSLLTQFFNMWVELEQHYIHKHLPPNSVSYNIDEGRFRRTFVIPPSIENPSNELIGTAIGEYIKTFDALMKYYLNNTHADRREIEKFYVAYLNNNSITI